MSKELQFLIYNTPQEDIKVDVVIRDETIWLTQKAMAELFDVDRSVITKHLGNIFNEGELQENSVCANFAHTAKDGKSYNTNFYSLDAIISVGYRVNSTKAKEFRTWVRKIQKEYVIKGFVIDDDRLKQGERMFGQDYFRELLERVRSIRASERRIYQQITDIFAECSIDYNKDSSLTKYFYAMVQNKFHFAITGQTAAEIIHAKADRSKDNMGLTTWKNAPDGRVLGSDVTVAKNYLSEKEIKRLERTVTGFFDYIENVIENRVRMTMEDMAASVDKFLTFNEYDVLPSKGIISKTQADQKALEEYEAFNKTQKIVSDFDKLVKATLKRQAMRE